MRTKMKTGICLALDAASIIITLYVGIAVGNRHKKRKTSACKQSRLVRRLVAKSERERYTPIHRPKESFIILIDDVGRNSYTAKEETFDRCNYLGM